ncbi:MAG: selenocysteine-specific translation elongation factor [Sphaerobacter thermophilus]|uniref:selenocysteine-specific translation elongation factor n=1 Tax=Sphaerobacter thermophilus TaxID=2057 RepID=UPI00396D8178
MSMQSLTYVVGTAGHVDHGKSTLVKALTGIDPDRLREEKEREMTIDLGFAWMKLPSGRQISIIDVPGHERFIKNMLAGVGGIDAALLVVAADEGPMPQTAEHLAILDLLQIERGLIVLTKTDLVDGEWRDLVVEEIREAVRGTVMDGAPVVPVSAVTGEGLDDLRAAIDALLDAVPPHNETGRPRLPIDRVFTVAGFGTVVTGTLLGGPLEIGQEVEILPAGRRGRVRGLQSHRSKVERAQPGSRTAVNLAGISVEEIARGDVLTVPGWLTPTRLLDARLRLVPDSPVALEQNDEVDFFLGSAETLARVTLLDAERIEPGQEGWVQFRFPTPLVAVRGDRFIVRRPSPSLTIGGGVVVDAHPRRHRRFRPEVIQALEVLASGTPEEIVVQALAAGPQERRALVRSVVLPESEVQAAIDRLVADGQVVALGRGGPAGYLIRADTLEHITGDIQALLESYHRRQPLRRGMAKEEVRSRTGLPARVFEEIVAHAASAAALVDDGETLRLPGHEITFTPEQREKIDRYLAALRAAPYTPPGPAEFGIDPEVAIALAETGEVVRVDEGIIFARETFEEIQRQVLEIIDREGRITLAQFRDHFGSSRKYAQAVLEYLDHQRVTRRVGDERVRYHSA